MFLRDASDLGNLLLTVRATSHDNHVRGGGRSPPSLDLKKNM